MTAFVAFNAAHNPGMAEPEYQPLVQKRQALRTSVPDAILFKLEMGKPALTMWPKAIGMQPKLGYLEDLSIGKETIGAQAVALGIKLRLQPTARERQTNQPAPP